MNKDEVEKLGIEIIETDSNLSNEKLKLIEQVKQLLPNVVNSDNVINDKALSDLFDITNTTANNQGYELTFAGKGIAKHKADTETTQELEYVESQSKDTGENQNTENVIIRGDNLDVLKILKQNYSDKIKMIYIDPPYNTGSDGFLYGDNFKKNEAELIEQLELNQQTTDFLENMYGTQTHSGWLAFMYPRLKLARDLLTDDGVIFISIDDNEQANLKIMCDEIFGEQNFITSIVWQKKTGASDSNGISTITENILVYVKDSNMQENIFAMNLTSYDPNRYKLKDDFYEERGLHYLDNLDRGGLQYSDSMNYGIKCPDGTICFPNGKTEKVNEGWTWKWGQNKVKWGIKNGFIDFKKSAKKESKWSVCYKNYLNVDNENNKINRSAPFKSIMITDSLNTAGSSDLNKLNLKKVFSNPKPIDLLEKIIGLVLTHNANVLDFFAGSGTTAHAIMNLNVKNNNNCKFISVQWDEVIDKNNPKQKIPYDFCTENNFAPVISSITIERINRAGDKIKAENPIGNVDIGYKVFNCKQKQKLSQNAQGELYLENQRNSIIDSIYNLMVATGKQLHLPIATAEQDKAYIIDNCLYIVGNVSKTIFEQHSDKQIYIDGTIDFPLQDYLNLGIQNKDNIKVIF